MRKKKILVIISICLMIMCGVLGKEVEASDINIGKVSLGSFHSAVVKTDGSLWMWGSNEHGALGDGTTMYSYEPIKIMDGVEQVNLGSDCSAVIKTDGSLWMWGKNTYGQLGNGTTVDSYTPIKVWDNVKQVELGIDYTAVIREDGSLWLWGLNEDGQIGDGTTVNHYKPVKIMNDVKQVSIDRYHSMAIKEDGSLWAWGNNEYGQLGDGTTVSSYKPKKIMEGVKQASVGFLGSVAIKEDGSLWKWGTTEFVQVEYSYIPQKIMTGIKDVSLGVDFIAIIKEDDSLWTWGENWDGRLGNGTINDSDIPSKIMEDVSSVSLGEFHAAVIRKDGEMWIWGYNGYGQLGNGTVSDSATPINLLTSISCYKVSYNANGGIGAPSAQIKYYGKALTLRTKKPTREDYVFQGWALTKKASKATYKAGGTYKGNKSVTFYAVWKKKQTITASNKSVVYKCSPFNLNAEASGGGDLTYTSDNKKVAIVSTDGKVTVKGYGKATITIKAAAKGNYLAATKKITVTVKPKKMTLGSVSSPGKKKLNVSWTKNTTVTGYEVHLSTKKDFSSNTHKITFASSKTSAKFINALSKKTYYVRIRAYKTVNDTKYYGAWSKVKSVWVK